ncbi:MAG TPA: hypothetical protein VNO31_53000 [Umezawaea sp.]|nr:hypothetical protein [Umezawaea sp.]
MRALKWISGVGWAFSWWTVYLEVVRWGHLTRTLRFAPPDERARPGLPLRAVRATAVAAPLVFAYAVVAERRR